MSTPAPPEPGTESRSEKRHRSAQEYVTAVVAMCADTGTRADLRSGLGRPLEQCARMHRWLAWRVPQDSFGERAHYAVASLIADRPRAVREAQAARAATEPANAPGTGSATVTEPAPLQPVPWHHRPNLGTGLGQAVLAGMKEGSAESHLRLLTRQGFISVHPRLPSLLRYVQDKGTEVDWAVLLEDLSAWDLARDAIATRWLQSFYRTLHAPRPGSDTPADAQSSRTEESETR
ncbi:type I-E CRISPR-associated protein Cse2/CasB [Streptacidiphilus cavernicola]|uniref:Type I-E CRISPR-associated protein Cse2/CasB n=1 Tax=Streptacidiphilus cavernicola TaxID=3342716 RepID=A0ABV6VVG5_9ACTN